MVGLTIHVKFGLLACTPAIEQPVMIELVVDLLLSK